MRRTDVGLVDLNGVNTSECNNLAKSASLTSQARIQVHYGHLQEKWKMVSNWNPSYGADSLHLTIQGLEAMRWASILELQMAGIESKSEPNYPHSAELEFQIPGKEFSGHGCGREPVID